MHTRTIALAAILSTIFVLTSCDDSKDASPTSSSTDTSGNTSGNTNGGTGDNSPNTSSRKGTWTQKYFDEHLSRTVMLRFSSDTTGFIVETSNDSQPFKISANTLSAATFGDWSTSFKGDTLKLQCESYQRTFIRGSFADPYDTAWTLTIQSKSWTSTSTIGGGDDTKAPLIDYDTLHWTATDTNIAGIWRLARRNSKIDTSMSLVFNAPNAGYLVDHYYHELTATTYNGKYPEYHIYTRSLGGNRPLSILAGDTLYLGYDGQQTRWVRRWKPTIK